ncbi:hypothetical protein QUB76_19335 [Microcoleus sp. D2B6]|uniref:hypothetical protein n=1 Tax=Microcoleus sp. C2C6 TaxID=3055325 RepID=UPI002FD3B335
MCVGNGKRSCITAKQYQAFREQLLAWDKTGSDRDRCSMMGEAVRFAIGLWWE